MNSTLLKAGFILLASAGFLLVNFGHKPDFKKLARHFKSKTNNKTIEPEKINFC